ncbi:hypothetical protein K402DRAFT_393215 [Aulographum hederae CBS 113979]|uniref:Uncharacterized protein n=1 Tax=Aulographum hederae CBS 113979 TaxID=1176131 RepID=A0A6G1H227_9PEZI|nr:hypothetical protein K402DRAFT_393215 [Aulographum hederae CBS 113979]
MAPPITASATPTMQQQRQKPARARIVPAVPLIFDRKPAQKPILPAATPDNSEPASAVENKSEPEPGAIRGNDYIEQAASPAHGVLTPKSDAPTEAAAARSHDGAAEVISEEAVPEEKLLEEPVAAPDRSPPPSSTEHTPEALTAAPVGGSPQQEVVQADKPEEPSHIPEILTTKSAEELPAVEQISDRISTPISVASSTLPSNPHSEKSQQLQHARSSISSVVFGGHAESPTSTPAFPPIVTMPYPHPPPNFMGSAPPFVPAGHPHQGSENGGMIYPPPHMGPPAMHSPGFRVPPAHVPRPPQWYGTEPSFRAPSHSPGPRTPTGGPARSNGDTGAAGPLGARQVNGDPVRVTVNGHGKSASHLPQVHNDSHEDPMSALRNHLSKRFGHRDFADYVLEVSSAGFNNGPSFGVPLHGVIIGCNTVMMSAMRTQELAYTPDGLKIIRVTSRDELFYMQAFADALRRLYGGPLLDLNDLTVHLLPYNPNNTYDVPVDRFRYATSYIGAGGFLHMADVVRRGWEATTALLRWDTVELALALVSVDLRRQFWLTPRAERGHASQISDEIIPGYQAGQDKLVDSIVDFLSHNFPPTFNFQDSVPQLPDTARLPDNPLDSRRASADPRLSRIQFGQVPLEEQPQNRISSLLSSILISLPSRRIQELFEHPVCIEKIGLEKAFEVLVAVTNEREKRRLALVSQVPSHPTGRWENVIWQERVETFEGQPGGRLVLEKVFP